MAFRTCSVLEQRNRVLLRASRTAASGGMAGRALAVRPSITRMERAVVNCILEDLVGHD